MYFPKQSKALPHLLRKGGGGRERREKKQGERKEVARERGTLKGTEWRREEKGEEATPIPGNYHGSLYRSKQTYETKTKLQKTLNKVEEIQWNSTESL